MPVPWLFLILLASTDEEAIWRALEAGDAAALRGQDTSAILKTIRRGRTPHDGKKGEYREEITDAFGRRTDLVVIVPNRTAPLGVMVVLHGLGGDADQLKYAWKNFAESQGLIVSAPSAQAEPEGAKNEDAPMGSWAKSLPHWWSYREGNFVFTALSLLKKRYAIDENRVFLSGYSMGGFGTWNLGLRYPDRFAAIVPFAGGVSRREYLQKSDDLLRPLVGNASALPIYFVHGDKDMTVPVGFARRTRDQLKEFGSDFEYREVPKGGHILNVREGSEIMKAIQSWLKPKRRNSHPARLRHYFVGDYCPQAYWLRVAGTPATVEAKIQGQTIDLSVKGATDITIYVDETLLDLSKTLKVTTGGKTVFHGKVEPSVETIVETWRAREDRELVYRAKIVIPAN